MNKAMWYPEMPPSLFGETDDEYTDRLTGADGTGRVPYDHHRNRQCSIGYHGECTDPEGIRCKCPYHFVDRHRSNGELKRLSHSIDRMKIILSSLEIGMSNRGTPLSDAAAAVSDCAREIATQVARHDAFLRVEEEDT